jgi:hypothetical protein
MHEQGLALRADDVGTDTAALIAGRHVTLVGPGGSAAFARSSGTGGARVELEQSVAAGFGAGGAIELEGAAPGPTGIAFRRSILPPGAPVAGVEEQDVARVADPGFTDLAGGDLTPAAGSPLIDRGVADGDTPALDLAGHARSADGDGDGLAVPDAGAYERAAAPPPAPAGTGTAPAGSGAPGADTAAPTIASLRIRRRRPAAIRLTLSEPARITGRLMRRRGGRTRVAARIDHAAAGGPVRIRVGRAALRRAGPYGCDWSRPTRPATARCRRAPASAWPDRRPVPLVDCPMAVTRPRLRSSDPAFVPNRVLRGGVDASLGPFHICPSDQVLENTDTTER